MGRKDDCISTEDCTKCPEHALVIALALLSERDPVVKDPRIDFRERIECIKGSNKCIRYRSEGALSALSR